MFIMDLTRVHRLRQTVVYRMHEYHILPIGLSFGRSSNRIAYFENRRGRG